MDERPSFPHWNGPLEHETDWFGALAALSRYLRGPDGCPWDREKSMRDFAGYAREEIDELLEAIESGDDPHIEEEWGDVFFVLLAAAAAAEHEGVFHIASALARAHEKMIRRHDHVFGDAPVESPEAAVARWNQIKARERGES